MLLSPEDARRFLISHHGLAAPLGAGTAGVRALLPRMRCIQLDPLDVIGTNADLCAIARLDGLSRGQVYDALLPGHAFEHFAKERCLLPATAFPAFRERAGEIGWWRTSERLERVDQALIDDVLAEVTERGPITPKDLADRGRVEPIDWSGWKSSARASTMALEILWVRCQVVVCGRVPGSKRYDVPARALPEVASAPGPSGRAFSRWALLERVEAAGLMPRASGPVWGQLGDVRQTLPDQLVEEGLLEQVQLPGTRRSWLAPAGFRDRPMAEPDERMRILGPLDPLLWDRALVERAFGFKYVWEVYKPASKREYGWYVCPLLFQGRLVGRIEARVVDRRLQVDRRWLEAGAPFDEDAYRACLERHAEALGVEPPATPGAGGG